MPIEIGENGKVSCWNPIFISSLEMEEDSRQIIFSTLI